jgi:HupE / UreJ protein
MRPAETTRNRIAWIAALLVGLLPGTIAAAHPPTDAAALVRVDGSGTVDCVVVHDTIALLAGKPSYEVKDAEIERILGQPADGLRAALGALQLDLVTGTALTADGTRLVARCTGFPSPDDLRAWQRRNAVKAVPCEMAMRLQVELPPGARTLSVQLPAILGEALLAVDRPGLQRAVLPLEAGLASPGLDVSMAHPAGTAVHATTTSAAPADGEPGLLGAAVRYVRLGFHHIVPEGTDHALFVLGLFLLTPFARPLLWQVTAFTAAHTITLTLAALGLVRAPASVVEPAIALSIAFVAVENLFERKLRPWRIAVVFVFGLVHGLGFAAGLLELDVPIAQRATAIAGFSVGVEAGHLAVLAAAFLLLGWTRSRPWYRARVEIPLSLGIGAIACWWAVQRMFGA